MQTNTKENFISYSMQWIKLAVHFKYLHIISYQKYQHYHHCVVSYCTKLYTDELLITD